MKATIYHKSPMFGNIDKLEVNLISIDEINDAGSLWDGRKKVKFTAKRKRTQDVMITPSMFQNAPWMVVVEGWGSPRTSTGDGNGFQE